MVKTRTLIRNANITNANTTYNSSEWTVQALNSFGNVGTHVFGSGKKTNSHFALSCQAFPNPSSNWLTIDISAAITAPVQLQVYTINGQLVHSTTLTSNSTYQLAVNTWENGMYLIHCQGFKRK